MLNSPIWRSSPRSCPKAGAGCAVVGVQLQCASLVSYTVLIITNIFLSFSVLLNSLYFNPHILPVFLFSPPSLGNSDQMALWCSAACWLNHSRDKFYIRKIILSNIEHQVGLLKRLKLQEPYKTNVRCEYLGASHNWDSSCPILSVKKHSPFSLSSGKPSRLVEVDLRPETIYLMLNEASRLYGIMGCLLG